MQDPSGDDEHGLRVQPVGDASSNGVTPIRTAGDILITYDLRKGGQTRR